MMHVAVISSGRPMNVPAIEQRLTGLNPTWYVGELEGGEYRQCGAQRVVEAGGLIHARNWALDDAFEQGQTCVQLSDDLKALKRTDGEHQVEVDLPNALEDLEGLMLEDQHQPKLLGLAPTANAFFFNPKKPLHHNAFVVGDFLMVQPSEPRFDPNLRLKEDYDFTAQHLERYGCALRVGYYLATFAHRTNRGGAVGYRTEELEQEAIAYLKTKWPDVITENKRRANEVLFKWKAKREEPA